MTEIKKITTNNYNQLPLPPTIQQKVDQPVKIEANEMLHQIVGKPLYDKPLPMRPVPPPPQRARVEQGKMLLWIKTVIAHIKALISGRKSVSISPTREVAGQRIYHYKKDLLPWFENIFETGKRSIEFAFETLKKDIDGLNDSQKEQILSLAEREKTMALYKIDRLKEKVMKSPTLNNQLDDLLLHQKKVTKAFKSLSKQLDKEIRRSIIDYAKNTQKACETKINPIALSTHLLLSRYVKYITENVYNIEGMIHYQIVNEDPMWKPESVTERPMAFTDQKTGESLRAVSTFQAAGPGFSAQAPRNRKAADAVASNFFRTTLRLKPAGAPEEQEETVFDALRSAITVEFDQNDEKERKKANKEILQQVINEQVTHWIDKLSKNDRAQLEQGMNPTTPLIFKGQTINFLTPDILRTKAAERGYVDRANDERTLALENLEAHRALDGYLIPYKFIDVDGIQKTLFVKYDLRYLNIPNNKTYSSIPESLLSSKELDEANKESWSKIETDVTDHLQKLEKEISGASSLIAEIEKEPLEKLISQMNKAIEMRQKIAAMTVEKRSLIKNDPAFAAWQKEADKLAAELKDLAKDPYITDEFRKAVRLMQKRLMIADLHADIKELYEGGLSIKLANMDQNRSALAARMVLLTTLFYLVYYGCRSGKDRTLLVEIEAKLLLVENELKGRILSYREEEKMEGIYDHREIMTMESGGVFENSRANLGANFGLNISGADPIPYDKSPAAKQYTEMIKAAKGFNKMAYRTTTDWSVPPSHLDYWKAKNAGNPRRIDE